MKFLGDFKKKAAKMSYVSTEQKPPASWTHSGSYAINRIISGAFTNGFPSSRLSVLAGPSGAGKSFVLCNAMREFQIAGGFVFALDSENALDQRFMENLGVRTDPESLMYCAVALMQDVTALISDFLLGFEKDYGKDNMDAPKIMIAIDSLDMLLTSGENEKFEKGDQTGDMGQRTKLIKHLLRTITVRIARLPTVTFIATHQVYANQDVKNGEGLWIVNNAVKYSASQICLITKLKLKDGEDAAEVTGIRMRVEAYKSRFAKLGSKVEIAVPYAAGMSPVSGCLELLLADKAITQAGAWYSYINGEGEVIKFQRKGFNEAMFLTIVAANEKYKAEAELVAGDVGGNEGYTTILDGDDVDYSVESDVVGPE